jgi:peptidoglycan/xylan/chitin deacetylase (PgdA/CDA1 family)
MRHILFLLLRLTGIPFFLREFVQRGKVTILCYHDPDPETAATHFRFLTRHYTIIPLRDYVDWCQGKSREPMPRKSLVVTFDDGHRNNYRLKDLLEKYNLPVTVFLCSGIVGTSRHYWWRAKVDRDEIRTLKLLPDEQRVERLLTLGFNEWHEYPERQALSSDEIAAMTRRVDFQAHTRLHPILPRCSRERAADEIAGSKKELETRFSLNIYAMAYPNGDYSEREIEIARSAGYECALTLDAGYNTAETELLRLRRIAMYDKAGLNEVVVKASGFWALLNRLFSR